jgi:MSHA biogenesis protein MshK
MAQRLTAGALALLAFLGASPAGQAAHAQALDDPMRPPQAAAVAAAAAGEAQAAVPGGSRLQSILLSPGRKLAVIDGRTVPLGGSVDGATLVAIRETEVVLQKGAERETLKLNPGVQIRPVPRLAAPKVTQ